MKWKEFFKPTKHKIILICIFIILIVGLSLYFSQYTEKKALKEELFRLSEKGSWEILVGDNKDLFSLNLDGKHNSILSEEYRISQPSLSPDGEKIAFLEMTGHNENFREYLTIANINGSNKKRLLEVKVDVQGIRNIVWSPVNEQEIAFLSDYKFDNESYSLHLFNISNKSKKIIAEDLVSGLGIPAFSWSPDGEKIVFTSTEGEIMIVNKSGSGLQKIINDKGIVPSWSPDGKTIMYKQGINFAKHFDDGSLEYGQSGSKKYYAFNINTKNKKEVFKNRMFGIFPLAVSSQPIWSPDSKYFLLYKIYDIGKPDYWIVEVDSGMVIHHFKSEKRPSSILWVK